MAVDGKWNVTLTTPRGSRDATLELRTSGAILSGSWGGPQGNQEFSGGTVEGNIVAWAVQTSGPMGPMTLRFQGTVEGDKMTGSVEMPMGAGSFSAARA